MKFLREAYGESDQLEDFVYLAQNKFRTFYRVTLKLRGQDSSTRYFAFLEGAREYYNNILKSIEEDRSYYEDADLEIVEVKTTFEEDSIANKYFMNEEE